MRAIIKKTSIITIMILIVLSQFALAAPITNKIQKVRFSQTPDKVRIVFDMAGVPTYSVVYEEDLSRVLLDISAALQSDILSRVALNDPTVSLLRFIETDGGVRAFIELKTKANYNVFVLKNPNRLVIDINKEYEEKTQQEVGAGYTYRTKVWSKQAGSITAHLLEIDPQAGLTLRAVLSNNIVPGVESVKQMADRVQALAAVNASYFAPNGEIIGLLKIAGDTVSVPTLPRTAIGVLPDGKYIIDQVGYDGKIVLPSGQSIDISGVNCERGTDGVVIYNRYYGSKTDTNPYGFEYIVQDGKVTATQQANSPIPVDGFVISAHGKGAQSLQNLKIGDKVAVKENLGEVWDKANTAIGAGPMLVKSGQVFITTKLEAFGSDVAGGRAPRTAIGVNKEGHILLAVVDGRQPHSIGMTLVELAQFMLEQGAVEAMNLDGGGSSAMVLNGRVCNKPSDGRERRVGSALAVVRVAN